MFTKNNFSEKKKIIILYGYPFLVLIVGVLGYCWIADSYVNSKICTKPNSFAWISGLWFLMIILIFIRPQIMQGNNGFIKKRQWLNWIYAFIVPFYAVYIEEKVWNTAISELGIPNFLLNYSLILLITIGFLLITRKSLLTYLSLSSLCWFYGLINHYVLEFKGCPPLYNDLTASKTALTVMGQYSYWLNDSIVYGTLILFYLIVCLLYFPPADIAVHAGKRKQILIQCGGLLGSVAMLVMVFHIDFRQTFGLEINAWSPVSSFYLNGAPVTLLISSQNTRMIKPENYSDAYIEEILGAYDRVEASFPGERPTVVVIMNESFSDLNVLGDIVSDEYLKNFYGIDSYIMRGYTYASVCGGGTCNSEFEFLTGSSMSNADLAYPYQRWNLSKSFNLAELFSNYGYETIAVHPWIAENWNRVQVYNWFGFDRYISDADMSGAMRYISWGASDEYDYEQIIDLFENRSKPLFIFNVTMQNHGGYGVTLRDDVELISLKGQYSSYPDVVNYSTLIRESDKAFAELLEYFSEQSDPVIICMFGDHQPTLNEEFISLFGERREMADIEKRYMTPYIIWSNYDLNSANINKDMSINFLGANLLDVLGIHTEYTDYLLDLEKEIPIINSAGYQTADGNWHSMSERLDELDIYRILQYYELFER